MELEYGLYVMSTGERILVEVATDSLVSWQSRTERKIARRKNRAQRFRDAIAVNDTIASWENFDDIVASGVTSDDLQALSDHIFKSYDRWFNDRLDERN